MDKEKTLRKLKQEIEEVREKFGVEFAEVVRCKDCKFYEIHKPKVLENCEWKGWLIPRMPSDFCSYGERRDDNEAD